MHHPSLGMFSNIFTFINDFSLAINIFRKINISPVIGVLGMFSNIFTFINDFSLAINIFRKINISPLRWICITPLLQAPESIS